MRILYKNLIDASTTTLTASSVLTGYPIANVQDQRLSTKWIGSGATEESVIVTLPTFSEYPDDPAGTTYLQGAWATVDGWATSQSTLVATQGTLLITAGATTFGAIKTIAAGADKTYRIKAVSSAGGTFNLYCTGSAGSVLNKTVVLVAGAPTIIDSYSTSTVSAIQTLMTGGTVADTLKLQFAYIGTGAYLANSLLDASGNGNHGTVIGCTPGDDGELIGDGVNDKIVLVNGYTHTGFTDFDIEFPNGHTSIATIQTLLNIGLSTGGFLLLYRGPDAHLQIQYRNATTLATIISTGIFTGYNTSKIQIHVSINWATGVVLFYRNGVYFSADTMLNMTVPVTGSIQWIGAYQNNTLFLLGSIKNPRIYNRALSAAEVGNLYNNIPFIGEYDGLVGWWPINHGLGVNSVAVLGHNLKTGSSLRIQGNSSNNWGAPELDQQITVNPDLSLLFLSSTYTYKYWRFYFGQGAAQIGRLFLGNYLTINPSSTLDFRVTKKRSDTVIHGRNRQKWASVGIGWRRFEFSFPETEEAMIYLLTKFYDEVGNHSSFIFCNFDTIRNYVLVEPCYVSVDGEIGFSHSHRMKHRWSFAMEEEK